MSQIEYEAMGDCEQGEAVRVVASIDDGGFLSAFSPLTDDFVVSAQGKVVD